jgi:hypothetical protein
VETAAGPQTATIKYASGRTHKVQYRGLRPLAVGRPQRSVPQTGVQVGSFVVAKGPEDGEWFGGIATAVSGVDVRYDMVESEEENGISWPPVWQRGKRILKQKVQPKGFGRVTGCVDVNEVKAVGSLTETWRLTEGTRRELEDLEVI